MLTSTVPKGAIQEAKHQWDVACQQKREAAALERALQEEERGFKVRENALKEMQTHIKFKLRGRTWTCVACGNTNLHKTWTRCPKCRLDPVSRKAVKDVQLQKQEYVRESKKLNAAFGSKCQCCGSVHNSDICPLMLVRVKSVDFKADAANRVKQTLGVIHEDSELISSSHAMVKRVNLNLNLTPDGDCFFAATAVELQRVKGADFGDNPGHALRQMFLKWMSECINGNKTIYGCNLKDAILAATMMDHASYLKHMWKGSSNPSSWGGFLEAACIGRKYFGMVAAFCFKVKFKLNLWRPFKL